MVDAHRVRAHAGAACGEGDGAFGVVEVALRLVEPRVVVQFDVFVEVRLRLGGTAVAPPLARSRSS